MSPDTTADLVDAGLIDDDRDLDDEDLYGSAPDVPPSRFLRDDEDLAQDRFDESVYNPPHID